MLLSAEHLFKNYGMKQLLADASLYLGDGDKIGVIGVNGTGKSTFLRMLAGAEDPDAGTVQIFPNVQVSYLAQSPVMRDSATVLEQVLENMPKQFRQAADYEARAMLNRLGVSDHDQRIGTLSGGQRKRVALAAALLHPADVLILDEPTNHLDIEMAEWLQEYLARFAGGLIMITHDRYFLDRVANRMVELDQGALYSYQANYSQFLELKAERLEMAESGERKRQSILRREYQWIMRGARARGTKSRDRIERFEALKNQQGPQADGRVQIASASSRLGKKTVELINITKRFGGKAVIRDFSFIVARDDRVGIVGRNGMGKSTLLHLIARRIEPDQGEVEIGATVKIGYFSQEARELPPNETVIGLIRGIANEVKTDEGSFSAAQMLERFLFSGDVQHSKISALSGGEKRRLYLLSVLMEAPNILLLDEPTNDLDVETLTILENYLEGFPGAVLAVSHDRYFLDKLAARIVEVREGGCVQQYTGGYTDYLAKRTADRKADRKKPAPQEKPARPSSKPQKLRFSYKEQREFDTIDGELEQLNAKISDCDRQIAGASDDYVRLQELLDEKKELESRLEEKTERWLYLNELAEKIAEQG